MSFSLACSAQAEDHHDHDAHVFSAGGIEVIHPWARAAARGADSLVFFELHVEGEADRLVSARTSVAGEVHIVGLTVGADGAGHREVGEIDIPIGAFSFDPGGLALELRNLAIPLEQGTHFDLVLEFAEAGSVEIEVAVEAAGATQHSHAGHSH
ncbi:MAG: hypothetical protein ABS76_32635 [Pelagibacterium sp. SCN 64-44]|nr:MAG: hypothetical protein ABS76_32635 [Pelagibacterium sp. SCN 64-44]